MVVRQDETWAIHTVTLRREGGLEITGNGCGCCATQEILNVKEAESLLDEVKELARYLERWIKERRKKA